MKIKDIFAKLTNRSRAAGENAYSRLRGNNDLGQLNSNKVTTQSLQTAHARGVRQARVRANRARIMLSQALDNFQIDRPETSVALDRAIAHERLCGVVLSEAQTEHMASIIDANKAQKAYLAAARRSPAKAQAQAQAAAIAPAPRKPSAPNRHITWPQDAALEHVRWIPARGQDDAL